MSGRKRPARIYSDRTGTSPEEQASNELMAVRMRLADAQRKLAAVLRDEVGAKHSSRQHWLRWEAQARREVAEATERLAKLRGPGRPALDGGEGESPVVRFRASLETTAKLDALVDAMGQDRSGVLRTLIDEEHTRRGL